MLLTQRQKEIVDLVKEKGPLSGDKIAKNFNLTRAALRSDLAILVISGILASRTKVGYSFVGSQNSVFVTDKIKTTFVKDVQSMPVVVNEDANAYDALVTMFTEDVGSIFVVKKQDILVGVMSRKDLLRTSLNSGGKLAEIPVKMVMTPLSKMIVTYPDESIVFAARKIIENEVDSLPVVQELYGEKKNYIIKGRFTKTNITRFLVDFVEKKGDVGHN